MTAKHFWSANHRVFWLTWLQRGPAVLRWAFRAEANRGPLRWGAWRRRSAWGRRDGRQPAGWPVGRGCRPRVRTPSSDSCRSAYGRDGGGEVEWWERRLIRSTSAFVAVSPQRGRIQFSGVNVDGGQSGGDRVLPDHGDHGDQHGEVWQSQAHNHTLANIYLELSNTIEIKVKVKWNESMFSRVGIFVSPRGGETFWLVGHNGFQSFAEGPEQQQRESIIYGICKKHMTQCLSYFYD